MTRRRWLIAFALVGAALVAQRLIGLGSVPPGLHSDEASIGWNAWTLAHHGTDEHGASFPLFIEAFGEYKNPVYVYLLAPFTWVLPLSASTVRLPAALCGIATAAVLALAALRALRSAPVAMATLVTAALTPWAVVESRLGLEAPAFVLCVALAVLGVAAAGSAAQGGPVVRWHWMTGVSLALAVYAYSSGRLLIALLVVAWLLLDRGRWRRSQLVALLTPVVAAYALLAAYVAVNPGALTRRLAGISIASDSHNPLLVAARFVRNMLTYLGPHFLAGGGDSNLRYFTGEGGMLLVTLAVPTGVGVVAAVRRRAEPLPRFLLLLLLLAPVPAALTNDGTPQSLRASAMLPALLGLAAYGWADILPVLARRPPLALLAAAAVAVEAGAFFADLELRYPARALAAFDSGELTAVDDARTLAGGHRVLLSSSLDQPYIFALFAFHPAPPSPAVHAKGSGDNRAYHDAVLRSLGMAEDTPGSIAAAAGPGDILVLAPGDPIPAGATVVERVTAQATSAEPLGVGDPSITRSEVAVLVRTG